MILSLAKSSRHIALIKQNVTLILYDWVFLRDVDFYRMFFDLVDVSFDIAPTWQRTHDVKRDVKSDIQSRSEVLNPHYFIASPYLIRAVVDDIQIL